MRVLKIFILVALGALFGHYINKYGIQPTPLEIEVIKEVSVETKPKVEYLNKTNIMIVPIEVDKDTLVKPSDYKYKYKDKFTKDGTEIKVEADGWGDINNLKFDIISKDTVKVRPPKKTNSLFISGVYVMPHSKDIKPMYGVGFDYVIRDKVIVGTTTTFNNNDFYSGFKLGFKF